jgi:hypothetical protein
MPGTVSMRAVAPEPEAASMRAMTNVATRRCGRVVAGMHPLSIDGWSIL